MAARKIKLKDQLGRVFRVSTTATPAAPATPAVTQPETARPTATVWKLIREIPANIQRLAKLAGTGFTTRGANGEWYQRSIAQEEGIAVTNHDGVAGNPTIGLAELSNTGGGALQKTLRDEFGRLAGTSAATTADLTEGTNLYYTDARADARAADAVADHVAAPDPHSQYTTTAEAAAAAPVQSVNGMTGNVLISASVPKEYIDGLRLEWLSSSSIRVGSGTAFIPSASSALELPAAVTKTGLSLTPSSWYHVYLYSNAGVGVPGHPIDASRAFQYRFLSTPTGAGLYIDLNGYRFFR